MDDAARLLAATPVLASPDIARSTSFMRDALGIVHPNGPLGRRPWGSTEFAILDPDGNPITFHERAA